ncbi:MAG: hypothetical protein MUF51_06460, partial [Vicinamibacteria bacterium]|nr:hypothetical protein [Vicinamibacteria bacterium]
HPVTVIRKYLRCIGEKIAQVAIVCAIPAIGLFVFCSPVEPAPQPPTVVHVFVALCDNAHQGIVPVPRHLGNGQDPKDNLYWGARYGLRTYMTRDAGWRIVPYSGARPSGVIERIVLSAPESNFVAGQKAYIVADAWDGREMRATVTAFLEAASGRGVEGIELADRKLSAGGDATLLAFIGHNGLMDFAAPALAPGDARRTDRAAMVLACASESYFAPLLERARAQTVVSTTGLMAPEAYVFEAALREWLATHDSTRSRLAAAIAYDRYQRCGLPSARRLFAVPPSYRR